MSKNGNNLKIILIKFVSLIVLVFLNFSCTKPTKAVEKSNSALFDFFFGWNLGTGDSSRLTLTLMFYEEPLGLTVDDVDICGMNIDSLTLLPVNEMNYLEQDNGQKTYIREVEINLSYKSQTPATDCSSNNMVFKIEANTFTNKATGEGNLSIIDIDLSDSLKEQYQNKEDSLSF